MVLAFDFGGTKLAIAIADTERTLLERTELSTGAYPTGQAALDGVLDTALDMIHIQSNRGRRLAGVGVSTMGITFPEHVAMAPNVPGWDSLRMESSIRDRLGDVPIAIENDVKAAAFAELRLGALQGTNQGLYFNFGTGIAMAYTLRNEVIHGHHGASGEIGYALRTKNGRTGFQDGHAPFEEFVGGGAIRTRATEHFGVPTTARDLFAMSQQHNAEAANFLNEILEEMAFQVTNVIIGWDPEKVVFGGGMMGSKEIILPWMHRYVTKFVPYPPILKVAHFDRDAGLYGAVELGIKARTPNNSVGKGATQ
jgi:glucokinase